MRFVRYADDFSIYTKTKEVARKVGNAIYKYLKKKLKLSINREKSGNRRPLNFTILGFGFVPTYVKGEKGKYQLVVSDNSWKKLKQKLKTTTLVRLMKRGYISMLDIYKRISPQLNEPLYTRPVQPVPIIPSGYSSVRGAPVGYQLTGRLLDWVLALID